MSEYKILKTTMGRRFRVRMTEEEIEEKELLRIALVTLPFLASAGMFLLWIKMG